MFESVNVCLILSCKVIDKYFDWRHVQRQVYQVVCSVADRWQYCSNLGTVRNVGKQLYLERAKKKIGIVKWTLQEQDIAAILNLPAVCDIQKGI